MRKAKRLLSGFLAVVMILGLLPDISVNAQEIKTLNSQDSMFGSMEAGGEISTVQSMPSVETPSETYNESANEEIVNGESNSGNYDIDDFNEDDSNNDEINIDNSNVDDSDKENSDNSDSNSDYDTDKDDVDKDDSGKDDSGKSDSQKDDLGKDDSNKDDSNEDDINNDDASKDDSAQDDSEQAPPLEDDPVSGETDKTDETENFEECQFFIFPSNKDDIVFTVSDNMAITTIEHVAPTTLYAVNTSAVDEVIFEASVHYGYKLQIPEDLDEHITEKQERELLNDRWIYHYSLNVAQISSTYEEPFSINLDKVRDEVAIKVDGDAKVEGVDEDGMAQLGSIVSIEVLNPGETLALISEDEKGNTVYTAMELDYNNCYEFTVEKELSFVVANPNEVKYTIADAESRKAKLTGVAGLKLKTLASSAQGYREIVLNFTAIPNGSDGTETEDVYYEVKTAAAPKNGETVPAGSSVAPDYKYYYIKKTENSNTQNKSIIVNNGDSSASTACTYEFSVRLVCLNKQTPVIDADTPLSTPLEPVLAGNTITKTFATKDLYYEDKLGFTKKNTKIYTGQTDLFAGTVKYSKKASYLHDLTAVAYNQGGAVENYITCTFKNDNDELYVSADEAIEPGKYTVVIYASIGETETKNNPQGGTMYQANTSFTLTVESGINYIDTDAIVRQVAVDKKNSTFSVVPVGWAGYHYYDWYYKIYKAKKQQFTYEIKSAIKLEDSDEPITDEKYDTGYRIIEPTEKVQNNISVNKNGKVTIKKGYTVDPDVGEDYIAIIIKAADFENNTAYETVYIRILNTVLIPTEIRLYGSDYGGLGTRFTVDKANYAAGGSTWSATAQVEVLDQFGNNMNQYVKITPNSNSTGNKNGVYHAANSSFATLYIHKIGTITIKAVSTDGGKKSKSVKFKVTAPEIKNVMYSVYNITYNGSGVYDYKTQTGLITYSAPKGSVIKIYHGFEINYDNHTNHTGDNRRCVAAYNRSWANWKYKIKGGKLKFDGNLWVITPTEKTATLSVWTKSNPENRWSIKFTNSSWKDYEAAPRVTLASGKIYSKNYSNEYVYSQQLTYRYDSGYYDSVGVTRLSKNAPYVSVSGFNGYDRTFKLNVRPENLKAGSYKYRLAFYNYKRGLDGDDVLSMSAKTSTITIKVHKAPKIKIASSYTLKTNQADSITLKCTPGDFVPDFEPKLLNANVGGKTNDFSDYFEVTTSTDSMGVSRASIKLKDSLTSEQKANLKGKKITGYVKYSYYYGYDYIENATSKVTITIK